MSATPHGHTDKVTVPSILNRKHEGRQDRLPDRL